jgi:hypothetical protein
VPLLKQGTDYLVLVTTPSQADAAQTVARGLIRYRGGSAPPKKLTGILKLLESGRVAEAAALISR